MSVLHTECGHVLQYLVGKERRDLVHFGEGEEGRMGEGWGKERRIGRDEGTGHTSALTSSMSG